MFSSNIFRDIYYKINFLMIPRSSRAFVYVTLFPLGRSLPSDVVWSVGADRTLLLEVKSCSRVEVQLENALAELVYRLVFANSPNEANNIAIMATGTSASVVSQLTQDCSEKRQFWVTWAGHFRWSRAESWRDGSVATDRSKGCKPEGDSNSADDDEPR